MSSAFTVGIIQESVTEDVDKNVERAEARIREAAEKGVQIVCLQELFNAPYFCKSQKHERFDLAEPINGPTIQRMQKVARELEMVIIVPIFERQAAGVYRNSAAVIDADGSLLGAYRKMHIPDDPLFNEKFYFTPGDAHIADGDAELENGRVPEALAHYRAAESLYSGELLSGEYPEPWYAPRAAMYAALFVDLLERLAHLYGEHGNARRAREYAERADELRPTLGLVNGPQLGGTSA